MAAGCRSEPWLELAPKRALVTTKAPGAVEIQLTQATNNLSVSWIAGPGVWIAPYKRVGCGPDPITAGHSESPVGYRLFRPNLQCEVHQCIRSNRQPQPTRHPPPACTVRSSPPRPRPTADGARTWARNPPDRYPTAPDSASGDDPGGPGDLQRPGGLPPPLGAAPSRPSSELPREPGHIGAGLPDQRETGTSVPPCKLGYCKL